MRKVRSAARAAQLDAVRMPLVSVVAVVTVLALMAALGAVPASLLLAAAAFVTLGAAHYAGAHRAALREREQQLAAMTERLTAVDAEHRSSRARMHEIRSTVAGIVSATQLLKSLPEDRRESFESMVDAEMDRLVRILKGGDDATSRPVEVDELLAHLVTSHRARGRTVTWQRSGLRAVGRYDDIAEAVNVLMDNAAVHGSADDIRVQAGLDGDRVTISVTDTGAGVAPELRDRLFQWGERRSDSPGQGIGLNVARALVQELGGSLDLDPTYEHGTRFVISLPAVPALVRPARVELGVAS